MLASLIFSCTLGTFYTALETLNRERETGNENSSQTPFHRLLRLNVGSFIKHSTTDFSEICTENCSFLMGGAVTTTLARLKIDIFTAVRENFNRFASEIFLKTSHI